VLTKSAWLAAEKGSSARRKEKTGPKRILIREDLAFPQQRRNRAFIDSQLPWTNSRNSGILPSMKWIFVLFALVAGAAMPLQAGINLRLKTALGDPTWAATVSFAVGTLLLFAYALVSRTPTPTMGMAATAPWWAWTGGLFGAFIVFSLIILAANLSAATMMAWILAGQFLAALILDHFGLLGFEVHQITWPRVLGVALLIAGALLVNKY